MWSSCHERLAALKGECVPPFLWQPVGPPELCILAGSGGGVDRRESQPGCEPRGRGPGWAASVVSRAAGAGRSPCLPGLQGPSRKSELQWGRQDWSEIGTWRPPGLALPPRLKAGEEEIVLPEPAGEGRAAGRGWGQGRSQPSEHPPGPPRGRRQRSLGLSPLRTGRGTSRSRRGRGAQHGAPDLHQLLDLSAHPGRCLVSRSDNEILKSQLPSSQHFWAGKFTLVSLWTLRISPMRW